MGWCRDSVINPFPGSTDRNTPVGLTGGDLAKPLNAAAATGIPDVQAAGNSDCETRVFLLFLPTAREALVRVHAAGSSSLHLFNRQFVLKTPEDIFVFSFQHKNVLTAVSMCLLIFRVSKSSGLYF